MKKLLLTILAILLVSPVFAQEEIEIEETKSNAINLSEGVPGEIIGKIPELKNAVLYNFGDNRIDYAAMLTALSYKGVNLDVGYSPSNVAIVGLSYEITNLEKLGVEVPILRHIKLEPVIAYGFGRIEDFDLRNTEEHVMLGVNLLNVRFW